MKKFKVTFLREFEVEVEAANSLQAGQRVLLSGPAKLLSVIQVGYVEKPCAACDAGELEKPQPTPPGNRPHPGGTPGTPTTKVPEIVDQIAKAA